MSAVNASVFAINQYCARNKFVSPLQFPYFALVLRDIGNKVKNLPVPRKPFSADHIRSLSDGPGSGWGPLRLAWGLFSRRLLSAVDEGRGGLRSYGLTGANVEMVDKVIKLVNVKAKNHRLDYSLLIFAF
jgi:hypothetical protein